MTRGDEKERGTGRGGCGEEEDEEQKGNLSAQHKSHGLQGPRLLLLLLASITVTQQGLPFSSASCCTQLAKRIPKNLLQKVTKVQFQKKDGICSLKAIVLLVENQLKCMDPNNRFLQQWVRKHRPKAK
ncbi:C-C motif chemokine 27 [Anomaloglossus baeobatrachus]|uniref:C-C motif chemokine 27 n=1 Tax=Anomaloglossus baeobatrachus TaxID=238106 RepID=UPI003F504FA4